MPLDLTDAFLGSLENLMLAQAQEGVWQRAVVGSYTQRPSNLTLYRRIV